MIAEVYFCRFTIKMFESLYDVFFYVKMELKDFGNGVIKYGRIKIVV